MKLSGEAESFIKKLDGFDIVSFENWLYSIEILAGQNQALQYWAERDHWNTKCVKKEGRQLRIQISNQALSTIKYLKGFDTEEFKIWFNNSVEFTKGDVLNYITEKK